MVTKNMLPSNPALVYTSPEDRGKCGFCGKEEGGYAKRDGNGLWQAACWKCVRPAAASAPQPKRKTVGIIPNGVVVIGGDEESATVVGKRQGLAPSSYRPKVK